MLAWLSVNLVNVALVAAVALIVALLIRGLIRDKKTGKSSCGGNCAACGSCGRCASMADRPEGTPGGASR